MDNIHNLLTCSCEKCYQWWKDAKFWEMNPLESPEGNYSKMTFTTMTDWNKRKLNFVQGEINSWSKDPSTKVSAALFDGKYQICSAYNGFPPGVEDTEERLNNRELKYKFVQHAEQNLISTCARLGIKTLGMSVAITHHPCANCAGVLVSAGISEIIVPSPTEDMLSRWSEEFKLAKKILEEGGIKLIIIGGDDD